MGHHRNICSCGRPIVAFTKFRRSVVSPGQDHHLCQRCWKSEEDRNRRIPMREDAGETDADKGLQ